MEKYVSDMIEGLRMGWEVMYLRGDAGMDKHIPWFPSFDAALGYAIHRNRWDEDIRDDDIVIVRRMDGGDRQIIITHKTQISEG